MWINVVSRGTTLDYQIVKIKVTASGVSRVSTIPLNRAGTVQDRPEDCTVAARVVSMDVAAPDAAGAAGPKKRTSNGAVSKVMISREILDNRATAAQSPPESSLIIRLERL